MDRVPYQCDAQPADLVQQQYTSASFYSWTLEGAAHRQMMTGLLHSDALRHIGTQLWGSDITSVLLPFHRSRRWGHLIVFITELIRGRPASLTGVPCPFCALSPRCQGYTHITHLQTMTPESVTLKCSLRVAGSPSLVDDEERVFQGRFELNLQHQDGRSHANKKRNKKIIIHQR